jgi:hypothetical protein
MTFIICDWVVPHTFGNHKQLTRMEYYRAIFHLDTQLALQDEEQFVLLVMTVPCQYAFDLGYFDERLVDFRNDTRRPMISQLPGNFGRRYDVVDFNAPLCIPSRNTSRLAAICPQRVRARRRAQSAR